MPNMLECRDIKGVPFASRGNNTYGYDDLYRLISATNPSLPAEAYTYDAVGNRLTSANTTGTWSYNANNELGGYNGTTLEYDSNGNTVSKTEGTTATRYVYDIDNRLARVENGSGAAIATYGYDPFGRRLWKEAAGVRTYFAYSDEGLVGEFTPTGTVTKSYGYKPGSTWTTDPLFMKQGSEYYFYHNDHLGTPQKMAAVNGAVVWSAQMEAFGKATVGAGASVVNNLRFPGQYYDEETGEHYNLNRYYGTGIGRYLKEDLLGLKGGINRFVYVSNKPTINTDPLGLFECSGCEWKQEFGDFQVSIALGGYVSLGNVNYSCKSNPNIKCKGQQICYGGGAIIGGGVSWNLVGEAHRACNSSSLAGDQGKGLTVSGSTWGISAPFGPGGSASGGASLKGGVAFITCYTYHMICTDQCNNSYEIFR